MNQISESHEQSSVLEEMSSLSVAVEHAVCARACEDLAGEHMSGVSFDNAECLPDCEMLGILVVVQMFAALRQLTVVSLSNCRLTSLFCAESV